MRSGKQVIRLSSQQESKCSDPTNPNAQANAFNREESVRLVATARAAAALAPGGFFIAEGFSRTGAGDESLLGPKTPDLLYDLSSLIQTLAGFRILEAFEVETWLAEGPRHAGPAKVVRLLARKHPFAS